MTELILNSLRNLGIDHILLEHSPVFTVEESTAHLPNLYPVKNLLLHEEKGSKRVLVIMKGDDRLDTKKLAIDIGFSKLRFAKPEILAEVLGVVPGSVSLFSILSNTDPELLVVLDSRLRHQAEIGFHPNDNTKTIVISGHDIDTFLGDRVRHIWRAFES